MGRRARGPIHLSVLTGRRADIWAGSWGDAATGGGRSVRRHRSLHGCERRLSRVHGRPAASRFCRAIGGRSPGHPRA